MNSIVSRVQIERDTSSCLSPSPLIPLPHGEGSHSRALSASLRHPASSDSGTHSSRPMILPLLAGEGWSEGEREINTFSSTQIC